MSALTDTGPVKATGYTCPCGYDRDPWQFKENVQYHCGRTEEPPAVAVWLCSCHNCHLSAEAAAECQRECEREES